MSGRGTSRGRTEAALKAHAAGDRAQAQRLYRLALTQDPADAMALHGLGVLAFEAGDRDQGLDLLEKAVRRAPRSAEFLRHQAHFLALAGRIEPAIAAFGALLALDGSSAEDWTRLGILQAQQGRYQDAAASFEGALVRLEASSPERVAALRRLGQAQRRAGLGAAAVESWATALSLDPGQADIALNLGDLLLELGRPAEAEAVYRQALAARPDAVNLQINLGVLLRDAGRAEEAEAAFRAALGLEPASALARRNLALALHDQACDEAALAEIKAVLAAQPADLPAMTIAASLLAALDRHAEALELADRILRLAPAEVRAQAIRARSLLKLGRIEQALDAAGAVQKAGRDADALHDAAAVFRDLGLVEPAIACYRQAIALRPGYVDAHVNLGGALLSCGRFAEGWAEYEWRWQRRPESDRRNRPLPQPLWDGTRPLPGRLLIWNEQGIGDEVMFSSLVPEIARDLDCVLECDPRLVGLLRRSLPGVELVARRLPPALDPRLLASDIAAQIPAGGLAARLRPTVESFAGKGDAYLRPDPDRRKALRARYDDGRLLVGIAWHSIADHAQGRSIALEQWEPVLRLPGARFVTVQYGDHAEEIAALARRCGVELLQDRSVDPKVDIEGFAAQLAALDLVITIDNSTAHFAGALGVPCWVLLPHWAEWRWLSEGSRSIWWRSLRLFRQRQRGDWREPMADVAAALLQRLSEKDEVAAGVPAPRFETALSLYHAKDFAAAAAMLEQVVSREPDRSEAWHLLGVVRSRRGDAEGALAALERAVALGPRDAEALGNLARLQILRKREDLAMPLLQQAVGSAPGDAGLWRSLARVKRSLGDIDGAIEAGQRLLALTPGDAAAMIDLGGLFARRGDPRRAHEQYAKAAALDPDDASIQRQLADAFRNLGLLAEAGSAALRAVALDPGHASGHAMLGDILRMMEDFAGAEAALDRALALAPDLVLGHFYKGLLENDLTRVDAAIACLDQALALDPDHADLHWNRAVMNIRRGRWREGFAEYEWRFRSSLFVGGPHPPLPVRPTPEALRGRRVLLTAEQGIGDAIQFLRYAALVARAGGTPILEVPGELVDLARSAPGVHELVARGTAPPAHDIAIPLMSLPHVFGTEVDAVPAEVPYLDADPVAVADWAKRLEALPYPRIGIAWQGNPLHRNDRNRSIALATLKPLIEAFPAGWVSLQKGTGSEQVAAAGLAGRLYEAGPALRDFADTAALVANLDLVVTIDSAVAHLCGALGRPVLLLLPWSPDFRWMLDRADTPWYPTMRLLRQAQRRDWSAPLAALRSVLAKAVQGFSGRIEIAALLSPAGAEDAAAVQRRFRQLRDAGKLDEAAALLEDLLRRHPGDAGLLSELSVVERKRRHAEAALAHAQSAVRSAPGFVPAQLALGAALSDIDEIDAAADAYGKALAIEPDNAVALINLSALRLRQGRAEEAEALGRRAVALAPQRASAHWNLAHALLSNGKFREGWAAYEWRWKAGALDVEKRNWPWPAWQGEPLQGRRILVFTEQGFGDAIQFVRLLPALKALGPTILLEVQPPLKRLLAGAAGVDLILARGDRLPAVDFQLPLMSLPHRLGLTLEAVPAPIPYLAAAAEARTVWAKRLADLPRPHIGLCWRGGRDHKVDRWRSLALDRLAPLLDRNRASFVSLQKEDDRAEIAAMKLGSRLRSVAAELEDFADTAALIEDLDLVISVDTAVGHLAGALGKPVWLLLGFAPDFRWMRDRADTPWYPSHRLYRQRRWGDWSAPLAEIGRALPEWLAVFHSRPGSPAPATNLKK